MYEGKKLNIEEIDVCRVSATGDRGFLASARCVLQKTITMSNSCDAGIDTQEDKQRRYDKKEM